MQVCVLVCVQVYACLHACVHLCVCMCACVKLSFCMCMYIQLMPTQSLPVGDTALGSGTHMDTQHTVTGECVHIKPLCSPSSQVLRTYLPGRDVPLVVDCDIGRHSVSLTVSGKNTTSATCQGRGCM